MKASALLYDTLTSHLCSTDLLLETVQILWTCRCYSNYILHVFKVAGRREVTLSGLVDKYQRSEGAATSWVSKHFWPRAIHSHYCGLVRRPTLLYVIYKCRLGSHRTTWRDARCKPISYTYFQRISPLLWCQRNQSSLNHWYLCHFTHMHKVTLRMTSREKLISHSLHLFTQTYQITTQTCSALRSCNRQLTLILRRSRTGTVWFYTSTSNKRAARPKLYTKSLTRDLIKLMYSRLTLVRICIKL